MKLIILDRDGVINEDSDNYIRTVDEWIPIPGSLEAIARLTQAGYTVTVATNQSGIARGYFTIDELNRMHQKLQTLLAELGSNISLITFCPHGPDDECECRKPMPGLFYQISDRLGVNLKDVIAVGDSLRDIEAATAANANPILVRTGKGEKTESIIPPDIPVFDNLSAVVDTILD